MTASGVTPAPASESSSLFGSDFGNESGVMIAAGIDTAFGLALVVFICGVIYNWRKGQKEDEQNQTAPEDMLGETVIQHDGLALSEPKPVLLTPISTRSSRGRANVKN
ncbi:hypothetical protein QBC43DRAFT_284913 [Cladorrhinum sp. PSN259]|nr:hypothetical protein QBC43DRAFT_284913 [Cladorrhinum sp. PSN259]